MTAARAVETARSWVEESGRLLPGFLGAFSHGSINWMEGGDELGAASDVDIMVVVSGREPPVKIGKFRYRGLLLEASYLAAERLDGPERVLRDYHLAGSFAKATLLSDPAGSLTLLREEVAAGYAESRWIRARCLDVEERIRGNLATISSKAERDEAVMAWLFAAGVCAHLLLVAGLENPTVRKRYLAARELLERSSLGSFYPELLEAAHFSGVAKERVEDHLGALEELFDAASRAVKSPFFFASDLSEAARPLAIDGSRELIRRGLHREALFWIAATFCRCRAVLRRDAPRETLERFEPDFDELLSTLGVSTSAELAAAGEEVEAFLPRLRQAAEVIIATLPASG